jgi:hypothetical protein
MIKPNGVALFSLHSSDDPESYVENFFGSRMYWSGFNVETNLKLLKEAGFEIIWSKLVADSLDEESTSHFVFLKK